jgi:hypothetical protein
LCEHLNSCADLFFVFVAGGIRRRPFSTTSNMRRAMWGRVTSSSRPCTSR